MRVALLVKRADQTNDNMDSIPIYGVEIVDPIRVSAEVVVVNDVYAKIILDITTDSVRNNLISNFDQFKYKKSADTVIAASTVMKDYYRQVSDVRRDPGMSAYALQQFQQLVDRFPNSEYAKNAENKILILKNYIAGKVMYAARDDMQKQNWTSAISRLQSVVDTAQETVMTPEAMFRLTECYTAIGLPEQADGYRNMLKTNFPDNEWTKKLK